MESDKPSSYYRVFLIGLESPQSIAIAVHEISREWPRSSLINSPLPVHVPLIQTEIPPPPPVPGLVPTIQKPLILAAAAVETEERCSGCRWLIWPVDSSGWFSQLAENLSCTARIGNGVSRGTHESQPLFPLLRGIPLAVVENSTIIDGLRRISLPRVGWRAMNLVCWSIEYLVKRPWYMSVAWYPIWRRRLRRAPKTMTDFSRCGDP